MLTEEEKQHIREEEIFRTEAQKSLARGKASQALHERVWSFLNTSFGIWVLSTIVIGIFAWGYSQAQSFQQNAEQVYKLDMEIEERLSNAKFSLLIHRAVQDDKPFYLANVLLLPPNEERMIFPEFAHRNLKSLLFELETRVPSTEEYDIGVARSYFGDVEKLFLNRELQQRDEDEIEKEVSDILNTRWRISQIFKERSNASSVRLFESIRGFVIDCILILGLTLLSDKLFVMWRTKRLKRQRRSQSKGS